MIDVRELRLSIEKKLNDRKKLLIENSALRQENKAKDAALRSHILNFVLEDCVDQIVNEILRKALEASKLVAEQTPDTGDYVVGVSIPSLHIRQRVMRLDVDDSMGIRANIPITRSIKTIRVDER